MTKMTQEVNILLKQKVYSPLQQLNDALFNAHDVNIFIKRDDLIHPQISGNKWRKLKHNLINAKEHNKSLLISFGGAYSNHIHALAHAGKEFGFKTLGIIRGEYDPSNPTLQYAQSCGMELKFISRLEYKQRYDTQYISDLEKAYPDSVVIPEGGTNDLALLGFSDLINEIPREQSDYLICPCGSGGTSAGLLANSDETQTIISIPVLKKAKYLYDEITQLTGNHKANFEFFDQYHQGGYGKVSLQLLDFIQMFNQQHDILLDPIYNGKMMMAFYDLLEKGHFKRGSSITLLHTGGIQGIDGMKQRGLIPNNWPVKV